jgi:hypothetical protein
MALLELLFVALLASPQRGASAEREEGPSRALTRQRRSAPLLAEAAPSRVAGNATNVTDEGNAYKERCSPFDFPLH